MLAAARTLVFTCGIALACAACSDAGDAASAKPAAARERSSAGPVVRVGVDAEDFDCESVAPAAAVGRAVGGDVKGSRTAFSPPPGVPQGCAYTGQAGAWTLDVDCRDGARDRGRRLMAQNASGPRPAAGGPAADAGPAASTEVAIGAGAMDLKGAAVVFLDDDTPCYGRVVGPDAEKRRLIAEIAARGLTVKTAPTGVVYRHRGAH